MATASSHTGARSVSHLVRVRANLLRGAQRHPSWAGIEARVADRLRAHFAAESLELRRIDLASPSAILNQIIHYEAVHEIRGPVRSVPASGYR